MVTSDDQQETKDESMPEARVINPVQFFSDNKMAAIGKPLKKDFRDESVKAAESDGNDAPDEGLLRKNDPDVESSVEQVLSPILNASDDESGDDAGASASSAPEDDDNIVLE